MIRVRYQDSSSGSHRGTGLYGTAENCPRGVTIYLVPGLTGRQRKAVIRRLRQEASRGCGPELPLPSLLVALGADRLRVAVGLIAAAVRLHPAVTLLPTGFVAFAMMLLVITSAGVRPGPAVAAAPTSHARPAASVGNSAVDGTIGFDAADAYSGALGPDGLGRGGRGLGSGQPALTTRRGALRAARVCFGAMPGVAPQRSHLSHLGHLACRQTRSSIAGGAQPDSRPSSG